MIKYLLFLMALSLGAQTRSIVVGSGTGEYPAGTSVLLTITLTQPAVPDVTGAYWKLTIPAGFTISNVTPGPALAPKKNIFFSTENGIYMVVGINMDLIPAGLLATMTLNIPASQPNGPVTVSLHSPTSVSADGSVLSTQAGTTQINVGNRDLNGDGLIDVADMTLSINQVLGVAACTNADLNLDNACNFEDVVALLKKILGLVP